MKNDPSPNSRKGKKGGPGVRVYMICRVHKYVEYREYVLLCHSDFIYSLSPDFSKMQADLRNNEIWVKTLSEEDDYDRRFKEKSDLMPNSLAAALTYA